MKVKTLILKISLLASLLIIVYFYFVYNITQGYVDKNYDKFTYKAGSLVIGISRAHDGISPEIIEKKFGNSIKNPVLNFAIERSQSPYGAVYLNAIKQKIDTMSNNGLFILSVSPGSLLINKDVKDVANEKLDKNTLFGKITTFNKQANYEYIRKGYDGSLYRGLLKPQKMYVKIHKNGWLEYTPGTTELNKLNTLKEFWMERANNGYKLIAKHQKKSEYRLQMLEETIAYLNNYGTVVLVRMPVDKDFFILENKFWVDFNTRIHRISKRQNVPYFDYNTMGYSYKTYDGSHLYGESAIKFTAVLCDDIKKYQAENNTN